MPELPEVETIRGMLEPDIINKCIEKVKIKKPHMLLQPVGKVLRKDIVKQKIKRVIRRGKYLILELSRDTLIFHLGMTGQLVFAKPGKHAPAGYKRTITGLEVSLGINPVDKHTHFIFSLSDGGMLLFRDIRTFGKVIFHTGPDWQAHPRIQKLGPEPLELKPAQFLKDLLPISSKRTIKSVLLDQTCICGVGNIYCDEALFLSRIHPLTRVDEISREDWKLLIGSIKKVLRKGIKNSGTTFSDYRKPDGSSGSNQEKLLVYGRAGQLCKTCGTALEKITVAQRGTVFCPVCQG